MPAAEGLIVVCQCHRSCRYVEVEELVPAAEGLIVVCQCHRSCRYVEVEQLVRYCPQVQFFDKVDDCPLLCSLGFGPDSA